jgi:MFS family permease
MSVSLVFPITIVPELTRARFLLGIGVGAEYPCGSVAASEQSEEDGISKNAQHRWFALATSASFLILAAIILNQEVL